MKSEICPQCNIEKHINNFYRKFSECKNCNIKRGVKRYFDKKNIFSKKINLEKNRDKLLQKQSDYRNKTNTDFEELHRSVVELQKKLKALGEKFKKNDPEKQQIIYERNLFKTTKKFYAANKIDVYHIDEILSLDILDLKGYCPKNNRGYRYVLVIIDNFSKFVWTVFLKNKNAQTIKDLFENIIANSKKTILIESDRGKQFYNIIFQDFLNKNSIKIYSRNSSYGAVFAERFNLTIRDLLEKIVYEQSDTKWVDILSTITKQINIRTHSSTKLMPVQASLKKNEGHVYKILLDKRRETIPKIQINDFVRTADLRRTFSKRDTTNWFYKLYKITETINDTIPSYKIDNSPERYIESLLKKIELSLKQNQDVMRALILN